MKLRTYMLLTGILLLAAMSYALGHLTGEKLQNFQYNAELVPVAPIVDGYLDDPVWENVLPAKLDQELISGLTWPESEDFTGSFKAVWRSGYLYVAVKLTDNQLETHQSKLFREDTLVIYIDPDHTGRKDERNRFEIPIGEEMNVLKDPLTMVAWGSDKQTCELSFRLNDLTDKGNSIGFSIEYNDVDSGLLQHKIAWAPAGYTEENDLLPDVVFTAKINPNTEQKLIRWGQIKRVY